MGRERVSTLSIHGFPWALRYLLIFENCLCLCVLRDFVCFMITLVSVLKSVIKHFENIFESV